MGGSGLVSTRLTLAIVAFTGAHGAVFAGPISIDGQTATSLSADPGGGTRVKIAPSDAAGHSRNTYSKFNVPKAGVTLDNTTAGANLILNEVTSTDRSVISGRLSIDGQPADVVIANPNGVTLNGAEFNYTGRTLVTTGRRNVADSAGLPRYNLGSGQISVGADGATTAGGDLHLYASDIEIDGKLDTAGGLLDFNAGEGRLSVGRAGVLGWIDYSQNGGTGSLVISSGSILSGGAIRLAATGANAGVNMMGRGLATAGNYQILSDGRVVLGGRSQAEKTLFVSAGEGGIELSGRDSDKVELQSQTEAVQLVSDGAIKVSDAIITGAGRGFFGFNTNAAVSLRAGGGLEAEGLRFASQTSDIELISEQSIVARDIEAEAAEDVIVTAGGDLAFSGSRLVADERVVLESTDGGLGIERSTLLGALGVGLKGQSIETRSSAETRTQVVSATGGVTLVAERDVKNFGALIQGQAITEGEVNSAGGVTVRAGDSILAQSVSEANIASFYAAGETLSMTAGTDIENLSGRLLSEAGIEIMAGGDLRNAVLQVNETHAGVAPVRSAANFGDYAVGLEIGQIIAAGDLLIKAKRFMNQGGDVSGVNLTFDVEHFQNQPERFGSQSFRKSCRLLIFCRLVGSSSVSHDGGAVTASEGLSISASDSIINRGGVMKAETGLSLDAPEISLTELQYYDSFDRPTGLAGLFRGRQTVQIFAYDAGEVGTNDGVLRFASTNPVLLRGTNLDAVAEPIAPGGINREDIDDLIRLHNKRAIGIFRDIVQTEK